MTILDEIVAFKKKEIADRKSIQPISGLEKTVHFKRPRLSLSASLTKKNSTGIIAEFKRKSPSKGFIHQFADVNTITQGYSQYGAAGLSVLTDTHFFGGSTDDLLQARKNAVPLLRKDFIIDEYQIVEAKSIGADVVLLIAACLTPTQVKQFVATASALGLETILELHAEEELGHLCNSVDMVGINNRNLKTFSVDIDRSLRMAEKIPGNKIKIAESGISSVNDIHVFRQHGFQGFLMGEHFMKQAEPVQSFKDFVEELQSP